MSAAVGSGLILVGCFLVALTIVFIQTGGSPWTYEQRRREAQERRDAEWLAQVDEWNRPHEHGAWCHPSADGCPLRPGM